MRIKNLPSILSMDGSQDALVIEQTDGSEDKSRKVSPAQIKQYVLGNSIDDIYSVMGQNGAKNLIPYPYPSNSYSHKGIDFTCLSDGTINVNGTNDGTGSSTFYFAGITLSKGTYIINGCPTQTVNDYRCGVARSSDSTTLASDYGSGTKFTLDADIQVRFYVQVFSGRTVNNITFKPMLRFASDTDETYQPYAKTNRQLTEQMAVPKYDATNRREYFEGGAAFSGNIDSTPTAGSNNAVSSGGTKTYVDNAVLQLNDEIAVQSVEIDSLKTSNVSACYGTLYKINGLVFLNFTALYNSEMSASNIALSLPSGFKPSSAVYGNGIILKSNGTAYTSLVKINANGNVFGDTGTTGNVLSGTIIYKV